MRENIASEVMKKSCDNVDSIKSSGLRRFFSTFFETMIDYIESKFECLVTENSQIRKQLREMRNIVVNIHELSQTKKISSSRSFRLEISMILDAVMENFDIFDDCVIRKVLSGVIIYFLSTRALSILMEPSRIVEGIECNKTLMRLY